MCFAIEHIEWRKLGEKAVAALPGEDWEPDVCFAAAHLRPVNERLVPDKGGEEVDVDS